MPRLKKLISTLLLLVVMFLFTSGYALAQTTNRSIFSNVQGAATLGVAHIVEMKDKKVKDGSVISATDKGAVVSTLAYDPQVLGVVARDAAIILNTSGANGLPIISTGTVYILVSTREGNIKKGDLLASSIIPGVAVKATKSGYVLGTALEDDTNSNTKQVDKIAADLNLHYFNSKPTFPGTLSDIFKVALLPTKEAPTPLFKYIVAAIVVIGSFILGFMSFGRTAAKGVEALGRNPAASKIIHLGIIFNVMIVGLIIFAGMAIAFLILRL